MHSVLSNKVPLVTLDGESGANGSKTRLADEALGKIRQAIVVGKLRPNQRLSAPVIAKELGISRTPVYNAFTKLEMFGYLSRLPNGGLVVIDHSPSQIRNIYEMREALATMAIRLVCQRAIPEQIDRAAEYHGRILEMADYRDIDKLIELDNAFHRELLRACGNEQLWSLLQILRDQYYKRRMMRAFNGRELRAALKQHERMLEGVRRRDARMAEKAVQQHVKLGMRITLERL